MWPSRGQDGAEASSSALQQPAQARTHVPFRSHEEPDSMGEDGYLRPETRQSARSRGSDGSRAGLVAGGAPLGRRSPDDGASDQDSQHRDDDMDDTYKAGMPIGLLAAMGTPMAKKPLFRSKKFLILCPIIGIVTAVVALLLLCFPILKAIASHTLNVSILSVDSSNITLAGNDTFRLTLEGAVRKAGIFPARLNFERPVYVYWTTPEAPTTELQLGHFALEHIGVTSRGTGRIKQQTQFYIDDVPGFSRFAQFLITQEEFTWRLKSEKVQAKAFGFLATNDLVLTKDLTLPGMANMTDVKIEDFQLPGDDPAGGISLSVQTSFRNPSAFGVELGILSVNLYYGDLFLGPAASTRPVNLTTGINNVHLAGRLVPYADNTEALDQLSTVFTRYLNGEVTPVEARGLSIALPDGNVIGWLTTGISALTLKVPLVSPTGPIAPINAITIKQLSLSYDPAQPYAPLANSSAVTAQIGLPFGFSLDIVQLSNQFSIVENKTAIANLSSPAGMASTTLLTQNAGFTTGQVDLDLPRSPLVVGPTEDNHLAFDQFQYDLTTTNGSTFLLVGSASAVTNTPLGQVKLDGIDFIVPAGLIGLESLTLYPTLIRSVDVIGGTPDAVLLNIVTGLTNPSNLDLTVGNVTFQLFRGESFLGTAVLPELHLETGYQEKQTIGYFQANNNNDSLATLNDFVAGRDVPLTISGFNGSTAVESLTQAFMAIHLNTTLPGLQTRLLEFANLTVLPTTGRLNNVADTTVQLNNPFTTDLEIQSIQSNVTAFGLFVGSIVTDQQFPSAGKASSASPQLPLTLNLYPPDIFALLRALVVEAGLPTEQIDGIVQLGGYTLTPTTNADDARTRVKRAAFEQLGAFETLGDHVPLFSNDTDAAEFQLQKRQSNNIYTGFDLPSFVLQAFSRLEVIVDLIAQVGLGEYVTSLTYSQPNVPVYTDSTLTLLLPVLAQPIVQKIVDQSILSVDTVLISNPSNAAFTTGLTGAIRNAGPFDAVIAFPTGLTVAWNGQPLGQIAMPNISLVGDVGAELNLDADFAVANLDHLTEFTGYLLTEPSFTWQIYGQNLSVSALGITVDGISISKEVVLDGFNGLRGGVVINSFDLPANDPAGGVSLSLQTTITNPSSVGVALSQLGFENSFGSTIIGPAAATSAFALTPKSTTQLPLTGRLVPQTSDQGLNDVSTLFNGFLHGVPADLIVRGQYAGPSDVVWLNEGIKQLAIAVILPAASNLQVITGIQIPSLSLFFSESDPWAPRFSSDTTASFQLPFAFPVDIQQIATVITAGAPNSGPQSTRLSKRAPGDFAELDVPNGPARTDIVARTTLIPIENAPFQSVDNGEFSAFVARTTVSNTVSFSLNGNADTKTSTAIGLLTLVDIAFDVDTTLLGLQGLNAQPTTVSDLDVFRGYPDYLQINVNARLYNPSNITIGTGDVAFGLEFNGQLIGTANLANLVLVPGENIKATEVRYQPGGGAAQQAGQLLLENFVQAVPSDTIILGTDNTTPIDSLVEALKQLRIGTVIPPLEQNLITQANLVFPPDIADTFIAQATFNLQNPFTASINLVSVNARATYQGIYLGVIDVNNLNPVISAAGKTTITSYQLPFQLIDDPKALINFLVAAAAANGVDLGPLTSVFNQVLSLQSLETSVTSTPNLQPETCAPTGTTNQVRNIILAAVQNLRTDLQIESVVRLDEYQTPLNFAQRGVPTVIDDSVLYLTGFLGRYIVQGLVDGAQLSFSSGFISGVTNDGFTVDLVGSLTNTGPFDALIQFTQPIDVIWEGDKIAEITLPDICAAGGSGVPDYRPTGQLRITNKGRFTDFAAYILLNPGFTWTIRTEKLNVLALQTIFGNVVLQKDISFQAFNGLPGVTIVNPDFPADSVSPPGIQLVTDSSIPSPSNLGIVLGTTVFQAFFEGQLVGPVQANDLTLQALTTTNARLTGVIVRRTSEASTQSLSKLFSDFLADRDNVLQVRGQEVISPAQPDSPVDWLSAAFKKLTLNVVLPGQKFDDIISAITIQDLTITITDQEDAYNVPTRNNETDATYKNPFGFSLTAKQAGGEFFINYNGVQTAVLNLPVQDAVRVETSNGQPAALVLNWPDEDRFLRSLNDGSFNDFFNAVTNTAGVTFGLNGAANVTAGTAAGDIPIYGIPFNVQTSLLGIQSLNARPTVVSNVEVYQGFPDYLQINADAALYNPSNLTVITNEVTFGLEFQGQIIGSVLIGDLELIPLENNIETEVRYAPQGDAALAAGRNLLQNFLQCIVSDVIIAGTPNTTPYGSLKEALGQIQIMTSIPPFCGKIITEASLSFPITIGQPGVEAEAQFDLSNPFRVTINLLGVVARAFYKGIYLGQINQPTLDPIITARGFQNITSRKLPFEINLDPKFLIRFLFAVAADNGVDLGILVDPFNYVLSLPSTESNVTTQVNTKEETCKPTGTTKTVQDTILAAVANLKTDLAIDSSTRLDEFQTPLSFNQTDVPTKIDDSVLYLTGTIGKPIVSNIVDQAVLQFSSGFIRNLTDNGLTVDLKGSLTNAGPFDALIEFPEGVDVYFQGSLIANIILPPICSAGGSGVPDLETTGILQIVDYGAFVDFTVFLLNNPQFTWTIFTNKLRVSALATIFDNVVLSKQVTFDAFNKLAPGVTLSNPDFPGDSSAPRGIELTVDSMIPSPSNLGIELGDVSFIASYEGQEVGPVQATDLTLPAKSVTEEALTGTIIHRDVGPGTESLGEVFTTFLMGQTVNLTVTGNEVVSPAQPRKPVSWLSEAFKSLVLNVALPGKQSKIIYAIQLKDLDVTIVEASQAYAAVIRNNETDVTFQNPYGFSLTPIQAGGNIIINYGGADAGVLNLPVQDVVRSETSTGQQADLVIHIQDPPAVFQSLNDGAYNSFFSALTIQDNVDFILTGGVNVTARTNAGDIPIGGIPFNVDSSFQGINNFGGKATIPEVPRVVGGGGGDPFSNTPGSTFLRILLTTILDNPAPLLIHTNFVSLGVIYRDYPVGRAYINPLDLLQGTNTIPAEFHYQPEDPGSEVAQDLLTQYVSTKGQIPINIEGDTQSSPYGSLAAALDGVSLTSSFPGQGIPLISDIRLYLDLVNALCNSSIEFDFRINNNLETYITQITLVGTASQKGVVVATFDYTFPEPFRTEQGQNPGPYSPKVPAKLPLGPVASLASLASSPPTFDVDITSLTVSLGGYVAPSFKYQQNGVPYTIGGVSAGGNPLELSLGGGLGALAGLLGNLLNIAQCLAGGGGFTLLPGLPTNILSNLPGAITSLIAGPISIASSIIGDVTSVVGGVVSDATSIVGGVVSDVTSIVGGVVTNPTSAVGGVVSDATSIVGGVVSDATSVVGGVVSDVTDIVGGVLGQGQAAAPTTTSAPAARVAETTTTAGAADAVTSVVGNVLGRRDEIPTPTPLFSGSVSLKRAPVAAPMPTNAPIVFREGPDAPVVDVIALAAAHLGLEHAEFQDILVDHGVTHIINDGGHADRVLERTDRQLAEIRRKLEAGEEFETYEKEFERGLQRGEQQRIAREKKRAKRGVWGERAL
ncbi:hypothetical protein ACM66B_003180 [Microbotryomycetes sp. NB124-2]